MSEVTLEGVLYALSDPARLQIVRRLTIGGCGQNCQSVAPADMPKSSLSHHLQILREAGLIRSERRGVEVVNTARCEELARKFPGLMAAILGAAGGSRLT
jgi:DNA-binding transcriptional ArsR family regulator